MNTVKTNPDLKPQTVNHHMKFMKTKPTLWMALCAALLLASPFLGRSQNQVPAAITYQGRLTDVLGNPVGSGYYEVQFRIWDDAVQNGAGNLVWGRSFPLHVVTNGLFNILLTDNGGQITTPAAPTNSLLDAFSGPDRYLGLTITISNNVPVSQSEISPRQQLASAPYAIQAQQANTVGPLGVMSTALDAYSVVEGKIATNAVTEYTIENGAVTEDKIVNGAVTKDKIGTNAVIQGKIAANAVTTATITNGAVTSAKLNIDGDVHLNGHPLYLGSGGTQSGLVNSNGFGGITSVSGPALFGDTGGVLGTTSGGQKAVLSWSPTAVGIEQRLDAYGSFVNLSSYVNAVGTTPEFTALADGMMMFYGRRGEADLQVWVDGGVQPVFNEYNQIMGCPFYYDLNNSDGRMVTWPIKKGDKFRWNIRVRETSSTYNPINNYLYFLPLGKNQANSSISP